MVAAPTQLAPSRVTIDPEFQSLIPPLSAEERAQLETNLVADGCRDPLASVAGFWDAETELDFELRAAAVMHGIAQVAGR